MNKKYQGTEGFCVLDDTPCKHCGKCAGMGMRVTKTSLLKMADKAAKEIQTAVFALNAALELTNRIDQKAPPSLKAELREDRAILRKLYNVGIATQLHNTIGNLTAKIEKTDSKKFN